MFEKKIKSTQKKKRRKVLPEMKWQVGEYSEFALLKFSIPYQFLLMCKILGITPKQILEKFMSDLDFGSYRKNSTEMERQKAMEYILECGFGQNFYSGIEIEKMFKELDAIGRSFPDNGEYELIDLYDKWRRKYHAYWFNKWFRPGRRLS